MSMKSPLILLVILISASSRSQDSCVTFDLEQRAEEELASDRECDGLGNFVPWVNGFYDDLDVELDVQGTRFIRPGSPGSCSRTLRPFSVVNGGVIEINCYLEMMEGASSVAYVQAIVQNYATGTILGIAVLNSHINPDGWHTLTINTNVPSEDTYIVLAGVVPEGSTLLIDSIRYVDKPELLETCKMYASSEESSDLTSECSEETQESPAESPEDLESPEEVSAESPAESPESPEYLPEISEESSESPAESSESPEYLPETSEESSESPAESSESPEYLPETSEESSEWPAESSESPEYLPETSEESSESQEEKPEESPESPESPEESPKCPEGSPDSQIQINIQIQVQITGRDIKSKIESNV